MKKLVMFVSFLLLLCAESSAIDIEDLLGPDGNPTPTTGLQRIQDAMSQRQNGAADPFSLGINTDGGSAPSPVKAIMNDFITKGLADPYGQDTDGSEGEDDDNGDEIDPLDTLPFFSGEGTGLFNPPEEGAGDWFASPQDESNPFFWQQVSDPWFAPGAWSSESQ